MDRGLTAFFFALVCLFSTATVAQQAGPQGGEGHHMRDQEWRIPTASGNLLMDTTVLRPPGNDRHPLIVINHGSPPDGSERATMKRYHFTGLSSFFVARGYVVAIPLRRGYGPTGGGWAEGYGTCSNPDYFRAGLETASDITATVDYMRAQSFVTADRTIIIGHSAGAWGTLALSSLNPPGVSAMIAFAPGRGGHQPGVGNCTPEALVKAAGRYGGTAHVPLLWVNAANDTFFEPKLVEHMVDAYKAAGGHVTHDALPAFSKEGHNMGSADNSASIWQPFVETFLQGK
jgi:dienelactone hydrolase